MGTYIHLSIGRLEVDWGKNNFFSNHGSIYQVDDLKEVPSYYAGENWPNGKPHIEMNDGFSKPLGLVKDRLELMGYTPTSIGHEYSLLFEPDEDENDPISYETFLKAIKKIRISEIEGKYKENYKPGRFVPTYIIDKFKNASEKYWSDQDELRPDHWEIDVLIDQFNPYSKLRMFAENPENHNECVNWDFTPLIESGWAERSYFTAGIEPSQRFLIVTEGSSDAKIINKAINLFRPHIADFFSFVDMEEGYPFTGTGNLYRFTQGLVSIGIQNNVIILYDNDAEGTAKLSATQKLSLPSNLRVMKLPNVSSFCDFLTCGPTGDSRSDINGKAASIECYLDLNRKGLPEPKIRWTSYNQDLGVYQGLLEHKQQFYKDFLGLRKIPENYDNSKIDVILDAIISNCVSIAEHNMISSLKNMFYRKHS